MEQKRD